MVVEEGDARGRLTEKARCSFDGDDVEHGGGVLVLLGAGRGRVEVAGSRALPFPPSDGFDGVPGGGGASLKFHPWCSDPQSSEKTENFREELESNLRREKGKRRRGREEGD